jgi:hypothetical protein
MDGDQRRRTASTVTRGLLIQGELHDTPLPETVQFIQSLRKTGQLALERAEPQQSACLAFVDGQVVHAFCPPLAGEACFFHLLSWREGRYLFLPGPPTPERTIDADTGGLLLEGLRRLDELTRLAAHLPPMGTVLHRRRDPLALRQPGLSFAHLRLWRRLDGRMTVGRILDHDGDPETARLLSELIAAGLASPVPDHRFLQAIVLAQTPRGATTADPRSTDAAQRLLVACDGRRNLADCTLLLRLAPEDLIAAAEYLLALRLVQATRGAEEAQLLG